MKLKSILAAMTNRELKACLSTETSRTRKDKREALITAIYKEAKNRRIS
jgi:hypothetical protein